MCILFLYNICMTIMEALLKVQLFKKKYQQDFMLIKLDELKIKNKQKRLKFSDKNKVYQREYYKLNKDEHKLRMKTYQQKNKEKINAYQREYRKKKKTTKRENINIIL